METSTEEERDIAVAALLRIEKSCDTILERLPDRNFLTPEDEEEVARWVRWILVCAREAQVYVRADVLERLAQH
jgi:hypothetical protein